MSSFLKTADIGLRSALFTKFGSFLDLADVNTGVLFYPKEVAFRMVSEKKGETLSEFVNVWRTRTAPSMARQRTPAARRGLSIPSTDGTEMNTVKAMPIDLEYNVWFWSKDIDNLNLIAEEYLFWQQSSPVLQLYYNDIYPAEFYLHFGEMTDESDVPSMLNKGTHFCMRVPIKMEGWIFASESSSDIIHKIELVTYDNQNLTDYRECIYEEAEYNAETEAALNLGEQHIFGILDVDTLSNTFSVLDSTVGEDDIASEFVVGKTISVYNSTSNDGLYTIVSVSDDSSYTVVEVLENIPDTTVDGSITLRI